LPSDNPARRVQDIIDNIDRIQSYTAGYSLERFLGDRLRQDAVERCITRISEAAKKLEGIIEIFAPGTLVRHSWCWKHASA
jgi:uncharacterized protein with HEPN domain